MPVIPYMACFKPVQLKDISPCLVMDSTLRLLTVKI